MPDFGKDRRSAFGGIAEAFGDANFRRYSVGSIVSWLSYFVQAVAVAWVTWSLTHSTKWLAIVALLDAVPMGALAPIGGVIADRYDRFRVLMICYALATLQSAILAGLAFTGRLSVEALAILAFAHGLIHAVSVPSAFGLLPRFVESSRLPSAIAVSSAYTQLGIFVGPALAGWVILHFGPAVAIASNVASYGVFFVSAARMRSPPGYRQAPASGKAFLTDLREGLHAILGHFGIRGLLTLMLFGDALGGAVRQTLPAFSDIVLHAGVEGFSTMLASAGVGATLSALWLAHGGGRRLRTGLITSAFLGFVIATAALQCAATLPVAAMAMVVRGFCFEICRTGTVTVLQTSISDGLRGRIMSAQFLLQQGANAVGVATVGGVADDYGLRIPLLCGCALAFAVWIAIVRRSPRIEASFAPVPL